MLLSIICPTYNEEKYIETCIQSILRSDYPKNKLEVIFVDGMSQDKTRAIISEYCSKYTFIKLIDNPERVVPFAMNYGVEKSKGDVIIRLDAHAEYPSNYFSVLVKNLLLLNADNVGVVCKTDVLNSTDKSEAIKAVLSNKFGVGNSAFRVGVDSIQEADTVPFGCFRRDVFDRYGAYDYRLIRNQDIELNKRIKNGGGKILLLPDSYCTYYAREEFKPFMRNNFQNGLWNILTLYYTKSMKSLSMRHMIPLFFVLSLILPLLIGFIWIYVTWISILSLTAYLSLLTYIIVDIRRKSNISRFNLMRAFFALHFSYGIGSIVGLLKLPFIKI